MASISRRRIGASLGLVPFFAYVGIFLFIPTIVILVDAFTNNGTPSLDAFRQILNATDLQVLWRTIELSVITALIGAVIGALVAYAVVIGNPNGLVRRTVTSVCGVLAQFGGVTLAFAFIATVGGSGIITNALRDHASTDISGTWLYNLPGLVLVYTYFQIPLMVIVFMPALDGLRPQWREAAETLGASTWQFWRHIGLPLMFPSFLGSTLLLFTNAFSAYATAAALISQGAKIVPLQIRQALNSEVLVGHQNISYALAMEMVVIVAIAMVGYGLLQRRTSGWLR
jgi:putative spermidine/putrescine transport system permease protein